MVFLISKKKALNRRYERLLNVFMTFIKKFKKNI